MNYIKFLKEPQLKDNLKHYNQIDIVIKPYHINELLKKTNTKPILSGVNNAIFYNRRIK